MAVRPTTKRVTNPMATTIFLLGLSSPRSTHNTRSTGGPVRMLTTTTKVHSGALLVPQIHVKYWSSRRAAFEESLVCGDKS